MYPTHTVKTGLNLQPLHVNGCCEPEGMDVGFRQVNGEGSGKNWRWRPGMIDR